MSSRCLLFASIFLALACGNSDTPDDTTAADTTVGTTSPSTTADDASSSSSTGVGTTVGSEAESSTQATSVGTETTDADSSETSVDESTGTGPTSGPGVLPGETGLDAFCRRYVECGGTYYADEQACIDASLDYWGECAARRDALDAFGACMSEIECTDYDPDAYNPASTPCSEQWSDLQQTPAC